MPSLKPSYWILARMRPDMPVLEEDLRQSWKEISNSDSIKPTGQNLDWKQMLSPLRDCIFLSYGRPYNLLVPGPDQCLKLEFDTDQLLDNGALTCTTLDGGLWAHLEEDAVTVAGQIAPRTGYDIDDFLEIVLGAHHGDCLPIPWDQVVEDFRTEFRRVVEDRFKREALIGQSARNFLLGLSKEDIDICVEIYYQGPLPLSMAKKITVPPYLSSVLQ